MGLIWNGSAAELNGTKLKFVTENYSNHSTTDEEVITLKGPWHYNAYSRLFGNQDIKSILEFGIFEGGSALILADMFPNAKIVGIDLRGPNPAVLRHIERLGLAGRVKLHYGVSQDDQAAVENIMAKEFDSPLEMIIDDCSHYYQQTRRSFEITFKRLKPGGSYIIEDWDWAHLRSNSLSAWKSPVLSNLVYELTSALQSSATMISEARILKGLAVFQRGTGNESTLLSDMIFTGDRPWIKL